MYQFKVAKWGNSLAMRIPSDMAKELGIKEGDQVSSELFFNPAFLKAELEAARARKRMTREEAIAVMEAAAQSAPEDLRPEDWKIDRSDPQTRG